MKRMLGLPASDPAAAARLLVSLGFDSLVVGAGESLETVRAAAEAGLRVWAYRAAFSVRHLAEGEAQPLLARDVDGVPRVWFGSGCPNQRALREAHLAEIERLARTGLITGFMLDGIRFASPNAGDAYFTCFCDACRAAAVRHDFDLEQVRREVAALRDWCRDASAGGGEPLAATPAALHDALAERAGGWLRFRAACVEEHVAEVRRAVDAWRAPDGTPFQLGAYLFTPAFAPLVGQRYGRLAPGLDVLSPMIYRVDTPGDAGLDYEWAALAARRLLPARGAFSVADTGAEVAAARALLPAQGGPRLVPILRLQDDLVAETAAAARQAGASGVDYFVFKDGDDEARVRAAAAAAGEVFGSR